MRKEVGKERATAVAEMLEVKTAESKKKEKVVKERRVDWSSVNLKIGGEGQIEEGVSSNPFAALAGNA